MFLGCQCGAPVFVPQIGGLSFQTQVKRSLVPQLSVAAGCAAKSAMARCPSASAPPAGRTSARRRSRRRSACEQRRGSEPCAARTRAAARAATRAAAARPRRRVLRRATSARRATRPRASRRLSCSVAPSFPFFVRVAPLKKWSSL